MALGFTHRYGVINEAIQRARKEKILICAAVPNNGNLEPIYFPAVEHQDIFGIFSANARNRESGNLNPSCDDRQYCFVIFGKGIFLGTQDENRRLEGTSYAASIVTGLMAMLLEFSRQDIKASCNLSNL
ncbi:hypothetical protein CDD83_9981 [Cordyceps sp. RAO-2017]|nr:hypothetical protein CDD83_9981 [Cordyceps sp. RAO-2017]